MVSIHVRDLPYLEALTEEQVESAGKVARAMIDANERLDLALEHHWPELAKYLATARAASKREASAEQLDAWSTVEADALPLMIGATAAIRKATGWEWELNPSQYNGRQDRAQAVALQIKESAYGARDRCDSEERAREFADSLLRLAKKVTGGESSREELAKYVANYNNACASNALLTTQWLLAELAAVGIVCDGQPPRRWDASPDVRYVAIDGREAVIS